MSMSLVFQQMLVIFILMGTGFYLFRSGRLSQKASGDLSGLITRITNPALMICSAFDKSNTATNHDLLIAAAAAVISYVFLILLGCILPLFLRVRKGEFKYYHMLTVYGNIGFIGIPVISALLGSAALMYLSIFILVFNILIYTHGMQVLSMGVEGEKPGFHWKRMLNPGTIAGTLTVLLFVLKLPVPMVIQDSLSYMGRCTTFLSMVVLGGSLAQMPLKELFGDVRMYIFTAIRFLGVPILLAVGLRPLVADKTLLGVIVLCLALPVANMPLMLAKQYKMDSSLLAKGIVLTTLLSLFTVTIASSFL